MLGKGNGEVDGTGRFLFFCRLYLTSIEWDGLIPANNKQIEYPTDGCWGRFSLSMQRKVRKGFTASSTDDASLLSIVVERVTTDQPRNTWPN